GSGPAAALVEWPQSRNPDGSSDDFRRFTGVTSLWVMDQSKPKVYFTLYNEDYKVLIGYIFESAHNPWLLDWQENQSIKERPWDGKVVARGLCIGNSAVRGIRNAVAQNKMFGIPTYGWIEAREKLTQNYAIFITEIPIGFKGV